MGRRLEKAIGRKNGSRKFRIGSEFVVPRQGEEMGWE